MFHQLSDAWQAGRLVFLLFSNPKGPFVALVRMVADLTTKVSPVPFELPFEVEIEKMYTARWWELAVRHV